MQATKYTITIEIEVLALDVIPGLLAELAPIIDAENRSGSLLKEDGDFIKWETLSERVDF